MTSNPSDLHAKFSTPKLSIRAICSDNDVLLRKIARIIIENDPVAFYSYRRTTQDSTQNNATDSKFLSTVCSYLKRSTATYSINRTINAITGVFKNEESSPPLIIGAFIENTPVGALILRPLWGLSKACELKALAASEKLLNNSYTKESVLTSLFTKAHDFHRHPEIADSNTETQAEKLPQAIPPITTSPTKSTSECCSIFSFRPVSTLDSTLNSWSCLNPSLCGYTASPRKNNTLTNSAKDEECIALLKLSLHCTKTALLLPLPENNSPDALHTALPNHWSPSGEFQFSHSSRQSNSNTSPQNDIYVRTTPVHRSTSGVVSLIFDAKPDTGLKTEAKDIEASSHQSFQEMLATDSEANYAHYYLLPLFGSIPEKVIEVARHSDAYYCGVLPVSSKEQYILISTTPPNTKSISVESNEHLVGNFSAHIL